MSTMSESEADRVGSRSPTKKDSASLIKVKQDCLEGRPPANSLHRHVFCSCDLDLDPMTSMCELDLGVHKV